MPSYVVKLLKLTVTDRSAAMKLAGMSCLFRRNEVTIDEYESSHDTRNGDMHSTRTHPL